MDDDNLLPRIVEVDTERIEYTAYQTPDSLTVTVTQRGMTEDSARAFIDVLRNVADKYERRLRDML